MVNRRINGHRIVRIHQLGWLILEGNAFQNYRKLKIFKHFFLSERVFLLDYITLSFFMFLQPQTYDDLKATTTYKLLKTPYELL